MNFGAIEKGKAVLSSAFAKADPMKSGYFRNNSKSGSFVKTAEWGETAAGVAGGVAVGAAGLHAYNKYKGNAVARAVQPVVLTTVRSNPSALRSMSRAAATMAIPATVGYLAKQSGGLKAVKTQAREGLSRAAVPGANVGKEAIGTVKGFFSNAKSNVGKDFKTKSTFVSEIGKDLRGVAKNIFMKR